jgi:hypothetical protein
VPALVLRAKTSSEVIGSSVTAWVDRWLIGTTLDRLTHLPHDCASGRRNCAAPLGVNETASLRTRGGQYL